MFLLKIMAVLLVFSANRAEASSQIEIEEAPSIKYKGYLKDICGEINTILEDEKKSWPDRFIAIKASINRFCLTKELPENFNFSALNKDIKEAFYNIEKKIRELITQYYQAGNPKLEQELIQKKTQLIIPKFSDNDIKQLWVDHSIASPSSKSQVIEFDLWPHQTNIESLLGWLFFPDEIDYFDDAFVHYALAFSAKYKNPFAINRIESILTPHFTDAESGKDISNGKLINISEEQKKIINTIKKTNLQGTLLNPFPYYGYAKLLIIALGDVDEAKDFLKNQLNNKCQDPRSYHLLYFIDEQNTEKNNKLITTLQEYRKEKRKSLGKVLGVGNIADYYYSLYINETNQARQDELVKLLKEERNFYYNELYEIAFSF